MSPKITPKTDQGQAKESGPTKSVLENLAQKSAVKAGKKMEDKKIPAQPDPNSVLKQYAPNRLANLPPGNKVLSQAVTSSSEVQGGKVSNIQMHKEVVRHQQKVALPEVPIYSLNEEVKEVANKEGKHMKMFCHCGIECEQKKGEVRNNG